MRKLLIILQNLLKVTLIFFICFVWLRFFLNSLWLELAISAITTTTIYFLTIFISKKTKNKEALKVREKEEAENIFLSLSMDERNLDFFVELIKSRHPDVTKKKNYLSLKLLNDRKVILFPFIKFETLSIDKFIEITNISKKEKINKLIILCYDYDRKMISLTKNFDFEIVLLDRFDSYIQLYKEYDFYPKITIKYKKEAKNSIKSLLAFSFNKSRTKGYLLAAIILLFSSLFVRPTIYYCIVASVLLIFALVSFINPKYNKSKDDLL